MIGAEDLTEAANWNLLVGKTLNDKYGCPWLTSMFNPTSGGKSQDGSTPTTEGKTRDLKGKSSSKYELVASKKMVGVFISVWMRDELLLKYNISNVKVCSVACGIMGYFGNKGSVSVSMSIEGTTFCFIVAHLASGEKKGDEGRRNHQVQEIFRRTNFQQSSKDDPCINYHPVTILGHE